MAFSVTATAGDYAASFLSAVPGAYDLSTNTLTRLGAQGSFEDNNVGFPSVLAEQNLGIPGNPAFVTGDTPGINIQVYNAATGVVEIREYDFQGTRSTVFVGGQEIAYGPLGFIIETIDGFTPTAGGKYIGTLDPSGILLVSNVSVNTLDANGNPITPAVTLPAAFTPIFGAVPEPSMGLMLGLGIVAVLAMRAVFGRARAA